MKYIIRRVTLPLFLGLIISSAGMVNVLPDVYAKEVSSSGEIPAVVKLGVGETSRLSVSGAAFKSGKKSVCTVNSKGKITAKAAGAAKITVTIDGKTAGICKVKVLAAPKRIKLNKSKASITVGDTLQLKAKLPEKTASNKITWSSNKKTVATVDAKGLVTGLKAGTVKITVKTFNGKKATCTVKVKKRIYKAGDIVTFGRIDQDNDSDTKEDIEWIVLKSYKNKLMLISKYGLDTAYFNNDNEAVTWETCSLRNYLNNGFIDMAFNDLEQKQLGDIVVNEGDSFFTDKVTLLSSHEAETLFDSDESRKGFPTKSAAARSAWRNYDNGGTCWWWLRSLAGLYSAVAVHSGGGIYYSGYSFTNSMLVNGRYRVPDICVRPVIYLKY